MDIFIIIPIGGGVVVLAFLIVYIIQQATESSSNAILAFIDNNIITISIILGIVAIIITVLVVIVFISSLEREKNIPKKIVISSLYSIGAFLVIAQSNYTLIVAAKSAFTYKYGAILSIFKVLICLVLYIINVVISVGALRLPISRHWAIILMYIWAAIGSYICIA